MPILALVFTYFLIMAPLGCVGLLICCSELSCCNTGYYGALPSEYLFPSKYLYHITAIGNHPIDNVTNI